MDIIRFTNGSEYKCGFCGQPRENILYIILENVSFADAAVIFSNTNNLQEITFVPENGTPISFRRFTVFEYLVNEPGGGVRAALRLPYVTEV